MLIIRKNKIWILIIFTFILIIFNIFLYALDKVVTPTVLAAGDIEIREKVISIINEVLISNYSNNLNYDDIIKVEKDDYGNISLIRANTLKMNKVACDVSLDIQNNIKRMGELGVKLPISYIFKNNLFSYFGPKVTIKMEPIGNIETRYRSVFESAGINQTKLSIYVNVRTKVRIIIPTDYNDIEIKNQIPISETVIVGKVPDSAFQLDLKDAGFKLPEKDK
ncbi:sporulation protein [Clostridium sp. DMHC 10]|uniref:sporulation protein YunB n=1 Tax=Clostridium sp. DMHC 10 TaxID=747377 RepID=UPI00069D8E45|nr:sporulation protein YunB [Clostridium sp. DMHC 10]KOF55941.1 sporulation protein [Clostridium sp. DMHC 10]